MILTCPEFTSIENMDQWINTTGADETMAYEDAEAEARLYLLGKKHTNASPNSIITLDERKNSYLQVFTRIFNKCSDEERSV